MAFKEKQILTCFLFAWLSFIKVSGFVVFNEEKSNDSAGSFNKNARTREPSDRGEEKPKSGAQVGRLLIWQDQALKSHGGGSDSLSSDLSSRSQPDENAYQSDDSGWMKLQPLWGQVYGLNTEYTLPVERLLGMKPTVDCVGDLMKLTVHGREAPFGSNFLIDRGSIPPLPLSQLPSECGHRFLRTWRDFVFIIPYDGCYVLQETNPVRVILNNVFDLPNLRMDPMTVIANLCKRDTFVLPLLWWGLPVKMSCSSLTSAKSVPTISCYTNGMIVRLHGGVSESLKIKLMNEWQPLLKVSATCGYSLVSHPEGVVIHAPYLPCTEPKDGMFTLSMAIESEFNLSCPALSFNLPIDTPDRAPENERISIPHALTSTELPPTKITAKTTQPKRTPTGSSTTFKNPVKKIPAPPNPYYIPGQTDLNPVPPSNHFLLFAPKIPPTILPQGPEIVATPAAVTQRPQAPVYIKHPQTWYPKPSWDLTRDPTQQSATGSHYPSNPLFPPSNMVYPLYPGKPEVVAPSSAVFPQDPYWTHHSQTQQRPSEPHASPKPEYEPPTPPPTRKPGPQLFRHPWYKPFPPRHSEMPPVPTKVPQSNTVSTNEAVDSSSNIYSEEFKEAEKPQASVLPYHSALKGPPMNLHFDFTPDTYPTPSLPKVVHTPSPIKTLPIPVSSSHAHSFHCPTFCPGPPSVFYHHHNHHHFGYPFQMSNFDISSMTKITGQMLSSAVVSPGLTQFPLIQDMGYNYGPLYPKRTDVPLPSDVPAMQYFVENPLIKDTGAPDTSRHLAGSAMSPYIFRKLESAAASPQPTMKPANVAPVIHPLGPSKLHSRPLQNRPVTEGLAYSEKSPNPAVNQAEMQRYFSPWDHDTQPLLGAPNNVPSFEKMVQHDVSSKPTMPPTHGKNVFMNYWYQAANPNARPPISDYPTKDSFTQMSLPQPFNNHNPSEPANELPQPEQTRESVAPVFRGPILFDTHWVPAVQTKKDVLFSGSQTDGHMKHPSTVD